MDDYYRFQTWLLERACVLGAQCHIDESGAYEAKVHGCSIFGLNAVSHFRRFVFPEGEQLRWLEERLRACADGHRIVLCHAPLRDHNSNDRNALSAPYLSRDSQLQRIVQENGRLCFITGHTHISVNAQHGCAEYDAQREILYLNDSSVTKTDLRRCGDMQTEREWADGAVMFVTLGDREMEIAAQTVFSGKQIARGYHRFYRDTGE